MNNETSATPDLKLASQCSLSDAGLNLLQQVEQLRLQPYDDQTSKDIAAWTAGATIGYGHLIKHDEWSLYQAGISLAGAVELFSKDLAPFVDAVRAKITAMLSQHQFDALVMLVYNIGMGDNGFGGSSVVKLVNNPNAKTQYPSLEAAWKAWNKSQGKVMPGLANRRACEWNVYSQGIYKKW